MNRILVIALTIALTLSFNVFNAKAIAGTATVPLSIQVNGNLVITDADNDVASGKNPTKNVSISITPDIGAATQSGSANFRVRTNKSSWKLTAQRTSSDSDGTGITDSDVKLDIAKSVGSHANSNAGVLVAPFSSQTNLGSISTTSAVDVITGSAKTSSAKDGSNANNYFQVNTTYSIDPDFFYTEGTYSTTITYNLVSP